MPKIVISLVYLLTFINFYELLNIECNYGFLGLWAVGNKYRCSVENYLFIDSPEKTQIDDISGTHMSGKSNNDEIYFHIRSKAVQYLPRGLEKFFKNVTGIAVWYDLLKEIHQSDFKAFKYLECVNIFESKIEIIEENVFDFNPNLVAVSFGKANIFHIGSTVFDHLTKLTSLHLGGNICINEFKENNRVGVEQIIRNVKLNCVSSEYLYFEKKLRILKNSENLAENLRKFELEFKVSKFASFSALNEKFLKLMDLKNNGLTAIDKPKIESTTFEPLPTISVPLNHSMIQNCTEIYQNYTEIDDLQMQNFESLNYLKNLTEDIKITQTKLVSGLEQTFNRPDNNTCNEKFLQLENKLTNFGVKFKKLENNLNEIKIKLDNLKIEEVEKRIVEKIEGILQDKFDKLLKDLKIISH